MRGDRLRAMRERRQLTQLELQQKCGLGANAIWKYENGENDPTADVLARIAKELDVSADYLLGLVNEPEQRSQSSDLSPDQRKLLSAFDEGDVVTLLQIATRIAEDAKRNESHPANVA